MKMSNGIIKIIIVFLVVGSFIGFLGQSNQAVAFAQKAFPAISGLFGHDPASQQAVSYIGQPTIHFAVIGDFGDETNDVAERAVADMVKGWNPDFIITTGDNNYESGKAATLDQNVGQYYSEFIYPYTGSYTGGQAPNRFFPALGNHDWGSNDIQPYLDYFPISTSPANTGSSGNERYYDFIQGPVHFFAVDNDTKEPDGATDSSKQAKWLRREMTNSPMPWQLVYLHHAPYSSGIRHGSIVPSQWPFAEWGADAVLAGHDHSYERIRQEGIIYFVNGLGGRPLRGFADPVPGSEVRYSDDYGAMLVEATPTQITFSFYAITDGGTLIDQYTISK